MPHRQLYLDETARASIERGLAATRKRAWGAAALCLGGPLAFGVSQLFNPKNDSTGQLVGVVALTAFMMFIFGFIPWGFREKAQRLAQDLEGDHVLEIQGTIAEKRSTKYKPQQVHIDGKWLHLSIQDYRSLSVGDDVSIQYTPAAELILKLERRPG